MGKELSISPRTGATRGQGPLQEVARRRWEPEHGQEARPLFGPCRSPLSRDDRLRRPPATGGLVSDGNVAGKRWGQQHRASGTGVVQRTVWLEACGIGSSSVPRPLWATAISRSRKGRFGGMTRGPRSIDVASGMRRFLMQGPPDASAGRPDCVLVARSRFTFRATARNR